MRWVTVFAGCLLVAGGIAIQRNTWGLGGLAWKSNRTLSTFARWIDRMGQDRFCGQQGAQVVVFGLVFVLIGARSLVSLWSGVPPPRSRTASPTRRRGAAGPDGAGRYRPGRDGTRPADL